MTTTREISRIADTFAPDRLMPRKCAGCRETDFGICAPCYRKLYPRKKVTQPQMQTRIEYRRLEIFAFVWAFTDETGYGVTLDWVKLNCLLTHPISKTHLRKYLNQLVKDGALVTTIHERLVYYWPAGNTLIKSDSRHSK